MALCRGNCGNLLQHWTFCEVICWLRKRYGSIHVVTTHSMAPWTIPEVGGDKTECRRIFSSACGRIGMLPGQNAYEDAWSALSVRNGIPYPFTALFAVQLWPDKHLSISLCESNITSATEIEGWLKSESGMLQFPENEPHRCDWRNAISDEAFWADAQGSDIVYVEMDPMRYERSENVRRVTDTLYPEDLELVVRSLSTIEKPVVLQMSSYSTNNNNPLDRQCQSMVEKMKVGGFALQANTKVDNRMGSYIFSRDVDLIDPELGRKFDKWLHELR